MDVIALAQHGIRNSVATLGTAVGKITLGKCIGTAERLYVVLTEMRRAGVQHSEL